MGTRDAVAETLAIFRDMLRLGRGDALLTRDQISSLMLQLDMDQEAYDFVKWYGMITNAHHDWRDVSLPFLDVHGADVFEDERVLCGIFVGPFMSSAILLLKIKLLIDVRSIMRTRKANADNMVPTPPVSRSPLTVRLVATPTPDIQSAQEKAQ